MVVLAVLLAAPASVAAQATGAATVPDGTPAGARIGEVAALLLDWRPEAVLELVDQLAPEFRDRYPRHAHIDFLGRASRVLRGARLHAVDSPAEGTAGAVFYSPVLDSWHRLELTVEPKPPYRITGLRPLREVPDPESGAAPAGIATAADLDAFTRRLADADLFSGGVLAARGDEVLLRQSYGQASRELGVPNTPDTRFILGSIDKMFTAVAVLQLVEQGRLALDDAVADRLPGVLPPEVADRVRIRHLLTHTSGLGDFLFTPDMWRVNRADYRTVDDYLPLLADDTLLFEPGTGWSYSNTGFLVLGAIIEAVTGRSYHDWVRERVFEPAGMPETGSPELDRVPRSLASTYEWSFPEGRPELRNDRYNQVVRGTPAGGGFSTLDDMHRFARALMEGRLLSPEMTARMLSPRPELGSDRYGFGAQLFGDGWVGHTGGGPGTADYFGFRPETGEVVVVLGNQVGETRAVVERARELVEAGPGGDGAPTPAAGSPAATPAEVLGRPESRLLSHGG